MFQLSEQQIETICNRLRKEGKIHRGLEQDLLDHFCCFMEEEMERGKPFERAYRDARIAITPNGVREIELERFFLLNFNKQLSMKKIIFVISFLAVFLLSTGVMFKVMHWPGARIIMTLSFAFLVLSTAIILVYLVWFFKNRSASFWLRSATGLTAVFLIAAGFFFKAFHIPGANVMYGLGTILLNVVFLPVFFFHLYRSGLLKR